jgi:hypothetical protein
LCSRRFPLGELEVLHRIRQVDALDRQLDQLERPPEHWLAQAIALR